MLQAVQLNTAPAKGETVSEDTEDDGNTWDTPATDGAVLSAMQSVYVKRWNWFTSNQVASPPQGLHWLGK